MSGNAAHRLKVVIVGAGIGGLSAHLAFARAGFEVAHYERRSELGPAGAGIVVWPDGVEVLKALGLGERLAAIGNRPDVLEVRDPDDRLLSVLPLGEIWNRTGAPGYVVSRTDLQGLILDAVGPERVQMGARCTGLEQSDTEVMVRFDGGLDASGDLAVGADGIHSAVRGVVVPEVEPSYAGIASWVGIVPNDGLHPINVVVEYLGEGKRCGRGCEISGRVVVLGSIGPRNAGPGGDAMNAGRVHRVVIVGGGFAGLRAAKSLRGSAVRVTLLDRRNHHVFQPLLYQVATGMLSPANIATPLRSVFRRQRNVEVLSARVPRALLPRRDDWETTGTRGRGDPPPADPFRIRGGRARGRPQGAGGMVDVRGGRRRPDRR